MNKVKVNDEKLKAVLTFCYLGGMLCLSIILKYIDKDLSILFQHM